MNIQVNLIPGIQQQYTIISTHLLQTLFYFLKLQPCGKQAA